MKKVVKVSQDFKDMIMSEKDFKIFQDIVSYRPNSVIIYFYMCLSISESLHLIDLKRWRN